MVTARKPDGTLVRIPASSVGLAKSKGYELQSAEQLATAKKEKAYGGTSGEALAGLAAAGRGATFGLSDAALTGSGLVAPETLAGLKEVNPTASMVGEIAGQAGSALAMPGGGLVGLAGKAGSAVGGLAAKALAPTGVGLASRIAARALPATVGSAIEGAAYGVGVTISEKALGDPAPVAEKLISNVGLNALLAGGVGGGLSTLGVLGGSLAGGIRNKLGKKAAAAIPDVAPLSMAAETPGGVAQAFTTGADDAAEGVVASAATQARREAIDAAGGPVGDAVLPSSQPRDAKALVEAYERETGQKAAPGLEKALRESKSSIFDEAAQIAGLDPEAATLFQMNAEGAAARRSALSNGRLRDKVVQDVTDGLDFSRAMVDQVEDTVRGASKAAKVKAVVRTGNEDDVANAFRAQLQHTEDNLSYLLENKDVLGGGTKGKEGMKYLLAQKKAAEDIIASGENVNARLFSLGDDIKKRLGSKKFANYGQRLFNSEADSQASGLLRNTLDGTDGQRGWRGFLEDNELWGKAAESQKTLNKAWSDVLQIRGPAEGMLFRDVGRGAEDVIRVADTSKIGAIADKIHKVDAVTDVRQLTDYFNRTKAFLKANMEIYDIPPEQAKQYIKGIEKIEGIQATLKDRAKDLNLVAQLKELQGASSFGSKSVRALAAIERAIGRVGDKVGTGFKEVLSQSDEQAQALRRTMREEGGATRGSVAEEGKRVAGAAKDASIGSTLRRVAERTKDAAKTARDNALSTEAGILVAEPSGGQSVPPPKQGFRDTLFGRVGQLGPSDAARTVLPIARSQREDGRERKRDERMAAYVDQTQKLRALASRPMDLQAAITHNTRAVAQHAPEIAVNMQTTATRAVNYLSTLLPKSEQAGMPPALQRPYRPSEEEVRQWERATRIINQPTAALEDMKSGRLTADTVKVLQAVYPEMHQQMVRTALEQAAAQPGPINYQNRLQLSLLMGQPLDPTMQPGYLNMVQQASSTPPQAPPGQGGGKPKTSVLAKSKRTARMASSSQNLERDD